MSEVTLRAARRDDASRLGEIEREADRRFGEVGHPEFLDGCVCPTDVMARSIDAGRVTVAEVDGVVAGWIIVTRSGGEPCVGQVSVLPAYGRRGVGTALLRSVIDAARAAGERSIVLNTQADVPWNLPWYARHGFVVVPRAEWTDDMHVIALDQGAMGFDWSTRAHMRLAL